MAKKATKKKRKPRHTMSDDDIRLALAERNAGRTYGEIAKMVGCSPDSVRRNLLKRGLAAPVYKANGTSACTEAVKLLAQAESYYKRAEQARARAVRLLTEY